MKGIFTQRQVLDLEHAGVEITVLPIHGERRVQYLRAAKQMLRLNFGARRFSLVHAHTGHCGIISCLQLRYPVLLSYVGYDLDAHLGDAETVRTTIERAIFQRLSLLLAGTIAKSARGARHLPPAAASRNVVIPNGVDRNHFSPLPREEARRRLKWRHDDPVVLFAADPQRPEKQFGLCEAAFGKAALHLPHLRLEVAANVSPVDMPLWYSASDVLVLTSVAEGSPNVVKEALACNLPVVSVDVGDVGEVINGSRHCHVVPAESDELAAAIASTIRALPDRSDGRSHTEWLATPNITSRILAAYREAVKRGPGPLGFVRRTRRRRPMSAR
jgi:glycosyltransferase involved in cell wall biosynthesis